MKKVLILSLVLVFVAMATVSFAGIASTKHNLSTSGTFSSKTTNAEATLCGFCHIPHGSVTVVTGLPLWARSMPAASYQLYGDGNTLNQTSIGEPGKFSKTCLSCHDGTIALGTIVKNGVERNFAMGSSPYVNSDKLNAYVGPNGYKPLISTDLRDDHPVGFSFPASGYADANVFGGANKPGIDRPLNGGGSNSPYITGATTNTIFPLFKDPLRDDSFECATCHDPHVSAVSKFLRAAQSTLCQDCHNIK